MNIDAIKKTNYSLDLLKFVCAILIVASHTLPIFKTNILNLYYGQWFFRFCVPVFFLSSGFYFQKMDIARRLSYVKRILLIYIASMVLYLPIYIKNHQFIDFHGVICFLRELALGYCHLWYLSALFFALLMSFILEKYISLANNKKFYITILSLLLAFGVLFDEYYKLFNSGLLNLLVSIIGIIGGSRHFLFMAFPLIVIGRLIFLYQDRIFSIKPYVYLLLIFFSFLISFGETSFLFAKLGRDITCDITIFNWITAVFLFVITFYWSPKNLEKISRIMRKSVDIVYVVHVLFIVILSRFTGLVYSLKFFIVLGLSFVASALMLGARCIFNERANKKIHFRINNNK